MTNGACWDTGTWQGLGLGLPGRSSCGVRCPLQPKAQLGPVPELSSAAAPSLGICGCQHPVRPQTSIPCSVGLGAPGRSYSLAPTPAACSHVAWRPLPRRALRAARRKLRQCHKPMRQAGRESFAPRPPSRPASCRGREPGRMLRWFPQGAEIRWMEQGPGWCLSQLPAAAESWPAEQEATSQQAPGAGRKRQCSCRHLAAAQAPGGLPAPMPQPGISCLQG